MMAATAERNIQERLRSASRIEPDRLPRLKLFGAEWAAGFARSLSKSYGSSLAVTFTGASLLDPGAADPASAPPAILAFVPSAGWAEPALALMDDAFADLVIEAICGGDGRRTGQAGRLLTTLDRRFVRLALDAALAVGNEVLRPVLSAAMTVDRLVSVKPEEALAATLEEGVHAYVELVFSLQLGRSQSVLRIALPESVLAPHRRKLTLLPEQAPVAVDAGWARDIQEGLQHADMQLRALLDEKRTTLGEIASFQVGQTIILDAHVESLITIECEEQRLFRGRMGRDRDSYVVRIEEAVDQTQEFIDDILSD